MFLLESHDHRMRQGRLSYGKSWALIDTISAASCDKTLLKDDPFQTIDVDGVGEIIKFGVERGRSTRANLQAGICGENNGDADSVKLRHKVGMNYVSCSAFRVPIAHLAAAQAQIENPRAK